MLSAVEFNLLSEAAKLADAAGHGKRQAVYADFATRLGISLATLQRNIRQVRVSKERKTRTDKGTCVVPLAELQAISDYLMQGYRQNNKKLGTIKLAMTTLMANGAIVGGRVDVDSGEFRPYSPSTVSRALVANALHPEQIRHAKAALELKSAHPNEVWQMDASISTLFYVPDNAPVADMSPAVYYKNKPDNFEKIKRQRLTRYVVTDHTSGALFVWYVAGGESLDNMVSSLLEAVRDKPGEALYGACNMLMLDKGTGKSKTFLRFLGGMGIRPLFHAVGNPRASGQVENAHNIVETQFEIGFKFADVAGIEWINTHVRRWCVWFNATQTHTRTKVTRLNKWMEITAEQLRLVDVDAARELYLREPKECRVSDKLRVSYKGTQYDVASVVGVHPGEKIAMTYNPLAPDQAYAVLFSEGVEQLHAVPAVAYDQHGFAETASHIGRDIRVMPDTVVDTVRKAQERRVMQAATDEEAAAKRKARVLPFGGSIDPYKHLDDLPNVAVLPRRGTAHIKPRSVEAVVLGHASAAMRLKPQVPGWDKTHYQRLVQRYPDGVPEGDLTALAAEFAAPSPTLFYGTFRGQK